MGPLRETFWPQKAFRSRVASLYAFSFVKPDVFFIFRHKFEFRCGVAKVVELEPRKTRSFLQLLLDFGASALKMRSKNGLDGHKTAILFESGACDHRFLS